MWPCALWACSNECGYVGCCLAALAMWAVAVGWVWLRHGCDPSDICSDTCRIHPIKVVDIRYPTDISHIIFGSDIRSDYPYPYPLSEKFRKFYPNQCSPSSNPDPDGYFPNHITSLLMGKVCDLCRGNETDISVVLMVMSDLGILFD